MLSFVKGGLTQSRKGAKNGDCSTVTEDFLAFGARSGRYLREKGFTEARSWMALEAMLPTPPKA